jgi:hypothetical protein
MPISVPALHARSRSARPDHGSGAPTDPRHHQPLTLRVLLHCTHSKKAVCIRVCALSHRSTCSHCSACSCTARTVKERVTGQGTALWRANRPAAPSAHVLLHCRTRWACVRARQTRVRARRQTRGAISLDAPRAPALQDAADYRDGSRASSASDSDVLFWCVGARQGTATSCNAAARGSVPPMQQPLRCVTCSCTAGRGASMPAALRDVRHQQPLRRSTSSCTAGRGASMPAALRDVRHCGTCGTSSP